MAKTDEKHDGVYNYKPAPEGWAEGKGQHGVQPVTTGKKDPMKSKHEERIERLESRKTTARRARRIQKLEDKASGEYTRKQTRQRKTGRKVEATKAEIDRIGEGGRKRRLTDRLGIQSDRLERLTPKTKTSTTKGGPAGEPTRRIVDKLTKVEAPDKKDPWGGAVKKNKETGGGTTLSDYVKTRDKHKKGTKEYADAQNKINEAYNVKKRH